MLDRLQSSTEQLETALQLQRQFVGDASHQLRTPLTSLHGNVELLTQLCAEDCPHAAVDQHQAILHDLNAESERMSRLVNGLLLLARADAQQHLTRSPLQLEPLIKDAWRTARSLSDSVSVKLGEIPSGLEVCADPDRLVQLFTTLLENAVHYSPPGGVVWLRARRGDSACPARRGDRSRRCGAWHTAERALAHFRALLSVARHGDGNRWGWARPGRRALDRGRARGGNQRRPTTCPWAASFRCGCP